MGNGRLVGLSRAQFALGPPIAFGRVLFLPDDVEPPPSIGGDAMDREHGNKHAWDEQINDEIARRKKGNCPLGWERGEGYN